MTPFYLAGVKTACELMGMDGKVAGFWGDYLSHSALNAGQAARDLRWLTNHPDADAKALEGTLRHKVESLKYRVPSLANNLFYTALPPQLHHTQSDLDLMSAATPKDWFLHGYKPWEHPDPLAHLNAHLPPEESGPGRTP